MRTAIFRLGLGSVAAACALAALLVFLLDRREHAEFTVPMSQCRPSEQHSGVWQWPLPASTAGLVVGKTPRRESSFLFLGDRLIPLQFPFDAIDEGERELTGWHRIRAGHLEFRLPNEQDFAAAGSQESAHGAGADAELRLELNGAMSTRRQLALVTLVLSLVALAIWNRHQPADRLGVWPLGVWAGLAPAALAVSFYICAIERLPLEWQFTWLGIAWDRMDAVAPGLLLVYACCGWWRGRSGVQPVGPALDPQLGDSHFARYGWLAAVTLFLLSFARMLSWGVGTTHAWSPIGSASPFHSAVAYSDAADYLTGGYHLLATGTLDQWNQRRPINAALLAARLAIGGWSVDVAKWLQAVGVACAAGWMTRELALRYGWRAAAAALAMLWGCGRLFLFTTLSEPLGFALGAMAMAGWLRQLRTGSLASGLAATGLGALAQAARPGALFVLPAVTLYQGSWAKTWRARMVLFLLASAIVGLTMAVNPAISRLYGTGENLTGSNFAYTFAGLASGQSWSDVALQYQTELQELPNEKAVATFLYQEGFRLIRSQPQVFLGQLAHGLLQFAIDIPRFLIGITARSHLDASSPLIALQVALMLALVGLALLRQWRSQDRQDGMLWLAVLAGTLASVPIVFLDGGSRVLMATWPAAIAWLAAGLARPATALPATVRVGCDRGAKGLAGLLFSVVAVAVLAPGMAHRVFSGAADDGRAADIGVTQQAIAEGPQVVEESLRGVSGTATREDAAVLWVDYRMSGPGITVAPAGEAERHELTPRQWQRELQIAGIGWDACLLRWMPEPPFRFDQVFDRRSGTLKIVFLPDATAEVESGTMAVQFCDGSRIFGRRVPLISTAR